MMPTTPPEPKLSSTILLLRDAPVLQVFMVKRHYQIDFAAGAMVFPGGKAREEDFDPAWEKRISGAFSKNERAARIAAIRETYEECGVLLARKNDGSEELLGPKECEPLLPHRSAVDKEEASFLELIQSADLVLATDKLVFFGHWITPEMMPKRFDTHFFIACAPKDQIAEHDGRETTDSIWIHPTEALELEQKKQATIIFPTRMNLRKLAEAKSSDEAIERFSAKPVVTVLPALGKTDDGKPCLNIPEEAGYGQTVELLDNVKV